MRLIPIEGKSNANLYRHPDTDIIYFWMSKSKRGRIQRSTGTKILAEARKIADGLREKFLSGKITALPGQLMNDVYLEWLATKATKSEATIARYEFAWKHLGPTLRFHRPEQVTAEWWEKYVVSRRGQNPKVKLFAERKTIKGILLFAHRRGYIEKIPYFLDPDPKTKIGKVFTDEEIKKLLDKAGKPLRLQILMALTMGMRSGEILNLSIDRIDLEKKIIILREEDTKTRQARQFAISGVALEALKEWIVPGYKFLFSTMDSSPMSASWKQILWKRCKTLSGVSGRFHDLRHTFLTRAFKTPGANAALICWYAGLSLEVAQRVYLHFDVEDTRAIAGLVGGFING